MSLCRAYTHTWVFLCTNINVLNRDRRSSTSSSTSTIRKYIYTYGENERKKEINLEFSTERKQDFYESKAAQMCVGVAWERTNDDERRSNVIKSNRATWEYYLHFIYPSI